MILRPNLNIRYPPAVLRLFLRLNLVLYLFDGSDWNAPTGSPLTTPATSLSSFAEDESPSGSTSDNLLGSRRDANMEIVVNALEVQFTRFRPGTQVLSALSSL